MKPDWKDAPEWAQYVAMDADGLWCWYECKPRLSAYEGEWRRQDDTKSKAVARPPHWRCTLEERPKEKSP